MSHFSANVLRTIEGGALSRARAATNAWFPNSQPRKRLPTTVPKPLIALLPRQHPQSLYFKVFIAVPQLPTAKTAADNRAQAIHCIIAQATPLKSVFFAVPQLPTAKTAADNRAHAIHCIIAQATPSKANTNSQPRKRLQTTVPKPLIGLLPRQHPKSLYSLTCLVRMSTWRGT